MRWPTSPSSVAENSIVWLRPVQWRRIHSTCGVNPSSAMRSASSRHDDLDRRRDRPRPDFRGRSGAAAWPRRSRRPRRARRSGGDATGAAVDGEHASCRRAGATGSSTSATCTASSRVGTSTRPSGLRGSATSVMRASIGTPKASVLPDPVLARPHTSRPVHRHRDRLGLDVERLGEPARGEPVVDARGNAQLGESGRRLDRRQRVEAGEVRGVDVAGVGGRTGGRRGGRLFRRGAPRRAV